MSAHDGVYGSESAVSLLACSSFQKCYTKGKLKVFLFGGKKYLETLVAHLLVWRDVSAASQEVSIMHLL
jgi:hypothetical protein